MIADDHQLFRDGLRALLLADPHAEVVGEAASGDAAVAMAAALQPDVILMDLQMPEVDGWQAVAAIRAAPETSTIPVLACTASSPDRDRIRSAGFTGCIAKPARLPAILDAIQTCCAPREVAPDL